MGSNHNHDYNRKPRPPSGVPASLPRNHPKYPRCDPARYRITEYNRDVTRCHALLTPDQERELATAAAAGDTSARERLIYSQLPLVMSIARKFLTNPVDFEDLISEGNLALIAAVDKLDTARARLSTFATLLVTQRIRRYVVAHATVVRRPASYRLSDKSRCRHEAAGYCLSLSGGSGGRGGSGSGGGSGDSLASDLVEDRDTPDLDNEVLMLALSRAIEELPKRERNIVLYRLRGETLQEVGRRYGVSRERIRQIEADVVVQLREIMRASGFAAEIPGTAAPAGGLGEGTGGNGSSTPPGNPQGWQQGDLGFADADADANTDTDEYTDDPQPDGR